SRIEAKQQTLCDEELVTIQVAGQPDLCVPALVAVHLRSTERSAFAALPAETQVHMGAREDDLIRRARRVPAHQDAHRVDPAPAREVLLGHSLASLRRQT